MTKDVFTKAYTLRFLRERHPLCGMGVTSLIEVTCKPAATKARIADSRPEPGPLTRTSTLIRPNSLALRAASVAAIWAAKGVDFFEPWKPTKPGEAQLIVLPCLSAMVTMVLLNDAMIVAIPEVTPLRDFFFVLTVFLAAWD